MRAPTTERMIKRKNDQYHGLGAGNQHRFPCAEGGGTVGQIFDNRACRPICGPVPVIVTLASALLPVPREAVVPSVKKWPACDSIPDALAIALTVNRRLRRSRSAGVSFLSRPLCVEINSIKHRQNGL